MKDILKIKNLYQAFRRVKGIAYQLGNKFYKYEFTMGDFGYLDDFKNEKIKPIKLLNDNYLLCENIYNLTENDLSWYDVEEVKDND